MAAFHNGLKSAGFFEPDLTAERPTGGRHTHLVSWSETVRVPGGTSTGRAAGDHNRASYVRNMGPESEPGDGGRKPVWGRIANAKSLGWAIYAVGFAIWLFGYLSAGHAAVFDWKVATPWWISSFVPNLEAELGLALMFASMIPIYGGAVRGNLARLFACAALLIFAAVTLAWWGFLAWLIWHVIWSRPLQFILHS